MEILHEPQLKQKKSTSDQNLHTAEKDFKWIPIPFFKWEIITNE